MVKFQRPDKSFNNFLQIMDGFGAGAGQFKAWEYKNGEIMVLELADNVKKDMESRIKNIAKPLKETIKISDFGSGLVSSSASYQKELKREQKRQAIRHRNQIKRDAAARAQIYIPTTPETAQSYEEITAIISDLVGGVPDDILHQTAYELLRLLKAEGITDTQRTQGIDKQLCVKVPSETIARLFTLSADLTDFRVNSGIDLQEADEDGIVTIGNEADDEELLSSSSDEDNDIDNKDDNATIAVPQGSGAWSLNRLREILTAEFNDEAETKLDIILKLLQSESGSKLETEIARVFGFKHRDIIASIIRFKDDIIKTDSDQPAELKRLDFNRLIFEEGSHFVSASSPVLPNGTETRDTDTYREITVPYQTTQFMERLVTIADLPQFAQPAFSSFQTLNRVQSKIYKTAMETDKNILVAAPTGAGKTNIALLCMLREFNIRPGSKVVYVAPMKSLVQEMVGSFSYRLQSYGKTVVELTGDSSASKSQLSHSDVIVTTPEKWDIITRKVGSRVLTEKVSLIIIDEIHLLHDERGPVLEALVVRMKRTVDTTRQPLRFVGLSATMPNYQDVAHFLRVDKEGLFYFDEKFRPCPLQKVFIGVRNRSGLAAKREMNEICFDKIMQRVETAQVLVFVHSRRETAETARYFIEKANDIGLAEIFSQPNTRTADILFDAVERAHNSELKEVLSAGFAFHNAGLDADDRKLVESLFAKGYVKVLVSTATLAWGVNLPAHTVIIKGTRVYNPEQSKWENLSHLDVLQMFGRAGRPQFDTNGEGIIITELRELQYYVSVLNQQMPIESHFLRDVTSHLNAEISLGSITSLDDAATWIGYTYLYVRMLMAPALYQVDPDDDNTLSKRRKEIVYTAALALDEKRLIRYDQKTGALRPTEFGRIAADFYITPETMEKFSKFLRPNMTDSDIFRLFCASSEFKNIAVRPEEKGEISKLINHVPIPIKELSDNPSSKINVLLQCYICRLSLRGFSLMADMVYISQNAERIMRCMYEIALSYGWADVALKLLSYAKMVGARMWEVQSPLRQFKSVPSHIVAQLERKYLQWGRFFDLTPQRLGELAKSPKDGEFLAETIKKFPRLKVSARKLPLTRNLIKFILEVKAEFDYDPEIHHETEPFWVFVCDGDMNQILHSEMFLLKSRHPEISLSFVVTLVEPLQAFYLIKVVSDRWIPCETHLPVTLMDIVTPDPGHQKYLRSRSRSRSKSTNPEETENDEDPFLQVVVAARREPQKSILIAAPINSGRTSCCTRIVEDAISIGQRIAVIVPVYDKFKRIAASYQKKFNFVSLTGDPDGDEKIIMNERLVIGTYAMFVHFDQFDTVFLHDIHLIGNENFADYESMISIMVTLECVTRFIAVSSPISNAKSVCQWLHIDPQFSFVYSPQMRDINFEIQTFNFPTSKSRLMAMSRPLFSAIKDSNTSIVFVPTQSQMFLTAFELINFAGIGQNPKLFARNIEDDGKVSPGFPVPQFDNPTLNQIAEFGVALYYPSLTESDKDKILSHFGTIFGCIVAVIESVWEINMCADVIAMKGTDIYDGTNHQHIEYPIVFTMEAMGYVMDGGRFVLFTHTPRKLYYLSFLTEPICVESNLDLVAQDSFNIEISLGLALSTGNLVRYITKTFFYRRLISNPSYYGLISNKPEFLADYVSELVDNTTEELKRIKAIEVYEEDVQDEQIEDASNSNEQVKVQVEQQTDDVMISILPIGQIAANHRIDPSTANLIVQMVTKDSGHNKLLRIICASTEMSMIPLRSPKVVADLMKRFPDFAVGGEPDDPSTFAAVLLKSHMSRLPIPDECRDPLNMVCTAFLRIAPTAVDVAAARGWLKPTVGAIQLLQRIVQAVAIGYSELLQLPFITLDAACKFSERNVNTIDQLRDLAGDEANGEEICKQIIDSAAPDDPKDADKLKSIGIEEKWQRICDAANVYPSIQLTAMKSGPTTINVTLERDIEEDEIVSRYVFAPRFPIRKTENWYILVSDELEELLSIQKVSFERKEEVVIELDQAEMAKPLRIYLISDSYVGCDVVCEVQ